MALVDEALKSKQKKRHLESVSFKGEREYDELGLRVQPTTDYVVARIMMLNPRLYTDADRQLVYVGRAPVLQNQAMLYRLSQSRIAIAPHFQQVIWARLLSLLPVMCDDKVTVIEGELYWDREKGELTTDGDTRREI